MKQAVLTLCTWRSLLKDCVNEPSYSSVTLFLRSHSVLHKFCNLYVLIKQTVEPPIFEYLCWISSVECFNNSPFVLQAVIFDEIDLIDLSFAECSIKNVNHCFQVRPVLLNALCPSFAIRRVVQLTSLRLYELDSWLLACCPQWAVVVTIVFAWLIFIKCC